MIVVKGAPDLFYEILRKANEAAPKPEPLPRTAREAKRLGLMFYYTGKPCRRGHTAARRTINSGCVECMQIAAEKWPAMNPEGAAALRQRRRRKRDLQQT